MYHWEGTLLYLVDQSMAELILEKASVKKAASSEKERIKEEEEKENKVQQTTRKMAWGSY